MPGMRLGTARCLHRELWAPKDAGPLLAICCACQAEFTAHTTQGLERLIRTARRRAADIRRHDSGLRTLPLPFADAS